MDIIKQIQTILGVTADGDFGPQSVAALFSASPAVIKQVQAVLGVAQDGEWGPISRAALLAAQQPATGPGTVIASEFATQADLDAYNKAKAEGKSEYYALSVGDNCIGEWGSPTNGSLPVCALPPETIEKTWGAPWHLTGRGKPVALTANGLSVRATVDDVMPHIANCTTDARIDLNPSACTALGLPYGAMVPVDWQPA